MGADDGALGGRSYSQLTSQGAGGGVTGGRGSVGAPLSVSARVAAAMGNQHSASHAASKPRKNVHWKSAGRPAVPGKPEIIPILSDDEPNAITLRWPPPVHDGGAPLQGYQVECNRLGTPAWIRTAPSVVVRPELVLTGLEPPHRYQFRVAALNAVGCSDYSELSDVLTISSERGVQDAPIFIQHLEDVTTLENDKTEFRVTFNGAPQPTIAWFKDGYEIFSSRRTAITTDDTSSVLVFHQTLPSDEGEIKCTATNRMGHAVTKARLSLEAAPKLRYPRQYEDGLLYEINETVFLKSSVVGKPTPTVEWRHDGQPIDISERIEIINTPKFSALKIHSARRSDRGEYQVHASNIIGEDTAAFLVTITAPPDPPRQVSVTRQVDKSVTLAWEPPEDDGGCRIGNYVVEYYRSGWNVWLKATTSRKTYVTLFDLIEGSEYRFRVKAESPYGMSTPSVESQSVRIPGRAVDMEFLAVESKIIVDVLQREDGERVAVSPAPRRKRILHAMKEEPIPIVKTQRRSSVSEKSAAGSNEFMLVLYPDGAKSKDDKIEKRKSFQLDLEDALSPPPISLSAPELSTRCILPFKPLRNSVSSTELLHEYAMARFYKAVAMEEEQNACKVKESRQQISEVTLDNHIPLYNTVNAPEDAKMLEKNSTPVAEHKNPEIIVKSDSMERNEFKYNARQTSLDSEASSGKWQNSNMSFDEDYTASTVSTDGELSDEGSFNEDVDRGSQHSIDNDTYNPRNKPVLSSPVKERDNYTKEEKVKPIRMPDPNFVPKPILKKRELDTPDTKEIKPRKEEKMTIFKKLTKMPVQKPFPFPKIVNKKESNKKQEKEANNIKPLNKIPEKIDEKVNDEKRTIIEHYGNIVKEYGSNKKPVIPLYLNTEDLKNVAEEQLQQTKTLSKQNIKTSDNSSIKQRKTKQTKTKIGNSIPKAVQRKQLLNKDETTTVKNDSSSTAATSSTRSEQKHTQKIVLKTAERATVIIPINYQELEQQAKINVRSTIICTLDVCLLLLGFWSYFFKDEILAVPFIILIIYRKVQNIVKRIIPPWVWRYTPRWFNGRNS